MKETVEETVEGCIGVNGGGDIPLFDSLMAAELETVKALNWVCPATLDIAATGLEALMKKDIMIWV